VLTENRVCEYFKEEFLQEASLIVKSPGRVNLIGEHTDYNGGFVLPAAINYYTWIAASARQDRELHIVAKDFSSQKVIFNLDEPILKDSQASWSNYLRGVVLELQKRHFQLSGGNFLISGNIPTGAGLSSSASLEIAFILALTELCNETINPIEAALIGQAAENNFVGCNCGIMDQLISASGKENSALLIDCENLTHRVVSIPAEWELFIVHSGVKRGLVESEYNLRRQQCETAAHFFNEKTLRTVSLNQLLDAEGKLDHLSFKRAHHIITENIRTLAAEKALNQGDMSRLSQLMAESHASMKNDFEITTPAIDTLVTLLQEAGGGLAGARMTGGGFGGCVIAIAPSSVISQLSHSVENKYSALTGCTPTIINARASNGGFSM
jgi:galactokinase